MRSLVVVCAAAAILAGCSGADRPQLSPQARLAADVPPNYRALIAGKLRETVFDPYSIRDPSISKPFVGVEGVIWGERSMVCVKLNAKNRFGAYVGIKTMLALFKDGKLVAIGEPVMGCNNNPGYEPFPEIDSEAQRRS